MRVAFIGKSGVGKDYLASYLIDELEYVKISFSTQLKRLCCKVFDWLEDDYEPIIKEAPLNIQTSLGEKIKHSPRDIWLKMNMFRDIENGIFIRKLQDEFDLIKDKNIIITDIRTREEFDWAKKNDFYILKIYATTDDIPYEENEFDKQQDDFSEYADGFYMNEYNGIEHFKKYFIEEFIDNEKSFH